MSKKLAGKVALVTGASKGIGAAIAARLAADGAAVAVNYSASKEGADRVVAAITAQGGKAVALHGDLTNAKDVERLVAETVQALGAIDILVNNAGIYEFSPLAEITAEHVSQAVRFECPRSAAGQPGGGTPFQQAGGAIVNISPGVSTITPANSAVYTATKASVDAITQVLGQGIGAAEDPRQCGQSRSDPDRGVISAGLKAARWKTGSSASRRWAASARPRRAPVW